MLNPLDELHVYERWAINALISVLLLILLGLGLDWAEVKNPLTDSLFEYFVDPIRGESTGDSGYNPVNTATYAIVLGLFVVALSAWLRGLGIDPSDASVLALLPFITWAAFGEVVEDAEMFGSRLAPYFVSPGIHFQAAFWVIIAGALGFSLQSSDRDEEDKQNSLAALASILIILQFVFYGWSISGKVGSEIDLWPMVLGAALGVAWLCLGCFLLFKNSTTCSGGKCRCGSCWCRHSRDDSSSPVRQGSAHKNSRTRRKLR